MTTEADPIETILAVLLAIVVLPTRVCEAAITRAVRILKEADPMPTMSIAFQVTERMIATPCCSRLSCQSDPRTTDLRKMLKAPVIEETLHIARAEEDTIVRIDTNQKKTDRTIIRLTSPEITALNLLDIIPATTGTGVRAEKKKKDIMAHANAKGMIVQRGTRIN